MSSVQWLYTCLTIVFFALTLIGWLVYMFADHHNEEYILIEAGSFVTGVGVLYVVMSLITMAVSADVPSTPPTGMSGTEKLGYIGLGSGAYAYNIDSPKYDPIFTGFTGYPDVENGKVGITFRNQTLGSFTPIVDMPLVRVFATTDDPYVDLQFRDDDTRDPVAYRDGTAAIPHCKDTNRLTFIQVWPTLACDTYSELAEDNQLAAFDVQPIVDRNIVSMTIYVPQNMLAQYQAMIGKH